MVKTVKYLTSVEEILPIVLFSELVGVLNPNGS